jgi:hypothetical protein
MTSDPTAAIHGPRGLGGWLIFHVLAMPLVIVADAVLVLGTAVILTRKTLAAAAFIPLLFLSGSCLVHFGVSVFATPAFYRKRPTAPKRMILLMCASGITTWVNVFVAGALQPEGQTRGLFKAAATTIGVFVWIAYFQRSVRVRNIFVA